MRPMRPLALTLLAALCLLGCDAPVQPLATPPGAPPADAEEPTSTATTESSTSTTTTTTPTTTDYVTTDPADLPPGLAWIRSNQPFISGLATHVGAPPLGEVNRYYDDFHATATHLWITGLPFEAEAWAAANHPDFRWLSWIEADGINPHTGTGVGDYPVTPGRIGYQIWDEPRNLDDVDAMMVGVDRVRQNDPDGLVVVNFGNADESISERDLYEYALQVLDPDVIAYDYYSSSHGEYERAGLIRELGLANDVPYWRYIDSFGDYGRHEPSHQDLRWGALLGLVYGFSGHTWFLYETDPGTAAVVYTTLFDNVGSWAHSPNALFWTAAGLNQELETYARTVNLLTSTDIRYIPETVLYMPDDTLPWSVGAGGDPWLTAVEGIHEGFLETQEWSIGFFEDDDGEAYFMVQNAAREGADFPLYRPRGDLRLGFDFGGAPPNVDSTRLTRLDAATGAVVDVPLTWLGGTEAELEWTLDAGDVLLLKYATGAPFAQMP